MINKLKYAISLLVFGLIIVGPVSAQTNTPTAEPTEKPSPSVVQESQIEKIKDLVASKVAELKLVDKRGLIGEVKSVSNTQITITDHKGQTRQIDIDELTKFEGNDDSFGISDVKAGDSLSFVGLYNKDTKRLLARFVSEATNIPQNIESLVVGKDAKSFTVNIIQEDGKEKSVDIETSTKTLSYEDGATVKSGFSKIEEGERIIIVGFLDKTDKDTINASRIIHFTSVPPSSKLLQKISEGKNEAPISTGSAAKLQPITKEEN